MKKSVSLLLISAMLLLPGACYTPKPQIKEPVPPEPFSGYEHWGNSYLNYSSYWYDSCSLAEHGTNVYHIFNDDDEIFVYDRVTKQNTDLGFSGFDLNIYNDILFYNSAIDKRFCKYDLNTGITEYISFSDIAVKADIPFASSGFAYNLIVGDYGMIFTFYLPTGANYLIHTDHDGNLLYSIPLETTGYTSLGITPVSEKEVCIYSSQFSQVFVYDMSTRTGSKYNTDFPLTNLMTNGDGIFYSFNEDDRCLYLYNSIRNIYDCFLITADDQTASRVFLSPDGIIVGNLDTSFNSYTQTAPFDTPIFNTVSSSYAVCEISFTSYGDMFVRYLSLVRSTFPPYYTTTDRRYILHSDFKTVREL